VGGDFFEENFLGKSFPQAPFKNFQLFLVAWFVAVCAVAVCSDDLRGALPTMFGEGRLCEHNFLTVIGLLFIFLAHPKKMNQKKRVQGESPL
jgi:hypothetical protein